MSRHALIKVPRRDELFARFPAWAFHVFTEKQVAASKALRPVGFSHFFTRHARVEVW